MTISRNFKPVRSKIVKRTSKEKEGEEEEEDINEEEKKKSIVIEETWSEAGSYDRYCHLWIIALKIVSNTFFLLLSLSLSSKSIYLFPRPFLRFFFGGWAGLCLFPSRWKEQRKETFFFPSLHYWWIQLKILKSVSIFNQSAFKQLNLLH